MLKDVEIIVNFSGWKKYKIKTDKPLNEIDIEFLNNSDLSENFIDQEYDEYYIDEVTIAKDKSND